MYCRQRSERGEMFRDIHPALDEQGKRMQWEAIAVVCQLRNFRGYFSMLK